jgi:hypothetical protein
MVRDSMLPEEQEIPKKVIREENDWIIWRMKPNRCRPGEEAEDDRTHLSRFYLLQMQIEIDLQLTSYLTTCN